MRLAVSPAPESLARPHVLWIAAHEHRRTIGLCREWSVSLALLAPERTGRLVWIRRVFAALDQLRRRRPDIVFVANPSLVLTTLAWLARPIFGYLLVVDAHNEGVRPFDRPYALVRRLTQCLLRGADLTLVSNRALAADVIEAGGRALVLPDGLPDGPRSASAPDDHGRRPDVVVIATYRRDEPIADIVGAAAAMPERTFVFTGHASAFRRLRIELPSNVALSGYLAEPDYWALLSAARVVCDLTLKDDCLVCGAYEALSLGKPMVLTDDPATRDIFGRAAVLARNDVGSIASALAEALDRCAALEAAAKVVREEYRERWRTSAAAVWGEIVAARERAVGVNAG